MLSSLCTAALYSKLMYIVVFRMHDVWSHVSKALYNYVGVT